MFREHNSIRGRSRWTVALCVAAAAAGGTLIGVSPASAEAAGEYRLGYTGYTEEVVIPEGVDSVDLTARGGGGGKGYGQDGAWGATLDGTVGAETSGVLSVQKGDVIRFGVGGTGQDMRRDGETPKGGWGGLGANGGTGATIPNNSSAGGGGATTVELVRDGQATTVMVAGGGGGDGGSYRSAPVGGGGGHGGDNATGRTASGSDGRDGENHPDSGGKAGTQESGRGEDGLLPSDGSSSGGPGGGGGGGANGGSSGLSRLKVGGGGGGAGSTVIDESVENFSIKPADKDNRAKNGELILSWH